MERGEDAEARRGGVIQSVHAAGGGEAVAYRRLIHERLEAGADVGEVVFEQVDFYFLGFVVLVPLRPEAVGIVRHVAASVLGFGLDFT